jgi:hypothetical protein
MGISGTTAQAINRMKQASRYKQIALEWGARFVLHFLTEIRGAICDGKAIKTSAAGKGTATAAATAVSVWVMSVFNLSNAVAISIGALCIHVVATAGKKSFCELTDDEVIAELRAKYHC